MKEKDQNWLIHTDTHVQSPPRLILPWPSWGSGHSCISISPTASCWGKTELSQFQQLSVGIQLHKFTSWCFRTVACKCQDDQVQTTVFSLSNFSQRQTWSRHWYYQTLDNFLNVDLVFVISVALRQRNAWATKYSYNLQIVKLSGLSKKNPSVLVSGNESNKHTGQRAWNY